MTKEKATTHLGQCKDMWKIKGENSQSNVKKRTRQKTVNPGYAMADKM